MKLLPGEYLLSATGSGQLKHHHAKSIFEAEAHYLSLIRQYGKDCPVEVIQHGGRAITRETLFGRANRERGLTSRPLEKVDLPKPAA